MQYIFIQYMILKDILGKKINSMANLKISLCGGLDNILRHVQVKNKLKYKSVCDRIYIK